MMRFILLAALLLWPLTACDREPEERAVDLTTVRLAPEELAEWAGPAVESGHHEITVRQVFTAQGPCRELEAEVMPRFPGEYMLRVAAKDRSPCDDDTPHLGYTAVLRGLPTGSHQLRIVHVGADGSTLAETVLEHPIIVTDAPSP